MAFGTDDGDTVDILSSWNVWGIPLSSPVLWDRQRRWRSWHDESILKTEGSTRSRFVICCFQEAWRWKCGSVIRYALRTMPSEGTWCMTSALLFTAQFVLQIVALACGRFATLAWDAKDDLARSSTAIGLNHAIGTNGYSAGDRKVLDSGLLILSTRRPDHTGFRPFPNRRREDSHFDTNASAGWRNAVLNALLGLSSWLESRYANKGMLWALWSSRRGGTIVITTHLTAGPRTSATLRAQTDQVDAICDLVKQLRKRFSGTYGALDTYVCGDFNLAPRVLSHRMLLRKLERATGLTCLTPPSYDVSGHANDLHTHVRGFQCDFIFGPQSSVGSFVPRNIPPGRTHPDGWVLSDHHLLVCDRRGV